jgi:hypothetical protein
MMMLTSTGLREFLIVNVDPAKAPSAIVKRDKTPRTHKETVCGIAGMILLVLIELLKSIGVIGKSEHCTSYTLLLLPIERKRGIFAEVMKVPGDRPSADGNHLFHHTLDFCGRAVGM